MAGIGDIGVRVSSDITEFTAGMDRVAQIAETSMRRAEQAQKVAQAASDRFVNSLQYQVDTFGKTDAEILKYKATLLGASSAADPLIARLEELKRASVNATTADGIKKNAHEMEGFSFATAGAKRELLVLTHELSQGNFKKFGGSMLVLGEQTGAASLLFSAAGLTAIGLAAAVGGLGVAMYHGAAEQKAMNDALILTGNYAGQTADSLNDLAHAAVATGGSIGEAKKVVTQLAASGKFTGEQIGSITGAVVALEHATGASVEETIKQFESLSVQAEGHSARASTAVSQATAKLDEQYHFLTLSVYNQITALEKEGDLKGASKAATDEFARVTKERAEEMVNNLGYVAQVWNTIKESIGGAADAIGNFGKKSTAASELKNAQLMLTSFDNEAKRNGYDQVLIDQNRPKLLADIATAQAELNRVNRAATDQSQESRIQSDAVQAAKRVDAMLLRAQSKEQGALTTALKEYHAELDKIRAGANTEAGDPRLTEDAIKKAEAALTKLHSPPTPKVKRDHDDPAQIYLAASLKEQDALIAREKTALQQREQFIAHSVAREYMTTAEGLAKKREAIAEDYAMTQAMYAKEKADTEARLATLNPVTQKKLVAEQEKILVEIEAKRAAAAQASSAAMVAATGDQLKIQNDFNRSTAEWIRMEGLSNDQMQFSIDIMGKNTLETAQLVSARKIYLDTEERIRQLKKQDTNADASGLIAAREAQTASANALLAAQDAKAKDPWFNAQMSVKKYGEEADNVGAQIGATMTSAFKDAEDAFVQFTMTGKLSFAGMAESILANLARIEARKAIAGLVGMAVGYFTGSSDGGSSGGSSSGFGYDYGAVAGARAGGGSVSSGASYLVGEKGPEIFTPPSGGTIIPNSAIGGSGGITINTEINLSDSGASSKTSGDSGAQGRALADMINVKIKDVLMRETRQGGILWNQQMRGAG